jgi:hypothetical protein
MRGGPATARDHVLPVAGASEREGSVGGRGLDRNGDGRTVAVGGGRARRGERAAVGGPVARVGAPWAARARDSRPECRDWERTPRVCQCPSLGVPGTRRRRGVGLDRAWQGRAGSPGSGGGLNVRDEFKASKREDAKERIASGVASREDPVPGGRLSGTSGALVRTGERLEPERQGKFWRRVGAACRVRAARGTRELKRRPRGTLM